MTHRSYPTAHRQNWLYDQSISLLQGDGVAKDPSAAFALNAEAAALGHHDAVLAMGWFYLNGIGVDRDIEQSWQWYRKSARQGDPRAMFSLGALCYKDRNYSGAHTWFSRAVALGHKRSLYWLGKLHWRGNGVPQDRHRAITLLQQASKSKVPEAKRALRFLSRH